MSAHNSLVAVPLLILFVVSACSPRLGTAQVAGTDVVLLGSPAGITALRSDTGDIAFTAPPAVPSPDRSRLLEFRRAGLSTRVAALDATTGRERAAQEVPGAFNLGAVSRHGRLVALTSRDPTGPSVYPSGRERTTLLVVDATDGGSSRHIDVVGNVEPEAFSTDERSLFVVDYLPPLAPNRYRVRRLDLASGSLGPVQTRSKLLVEEEMRGRSRQQVHSPDGKLLYTLYLKEDEHVHARDQVAAGGTGRSSGAQAFVHVLHLEEQWTFCLDLPPQLGAGTAGSHAMAISTDGGSLYVANWASGSVAVADTRTFELRHKVKVFRDESGGEPAVAHAGNGTLYLAGGGRLLAIDGSTLKVLASHEVAGPVLALELSHDVRRLYVAFPREVGVLDPHTWALLQSLPVVGAEWIARTGR